MNLSSIPFDTLIHIQTFLDVEDVVSLRQCCKSISMSTRERTLWMTLLRRRLSRNGVLLSTFPMAELSLALLEHFVTLPERFLARIKSRIDRGYSTWQPDATRILERHHPHISKWDPAMLGSFESLKLLPGGRFMVTATNNSIIELWDLGYNPSSILPHQPLAYLRVQERLVLTDSTEIQPLTHVMDDSSGFLLFFHSEDDENFHFDMYSMHPLSPTPGFLHIGRCSERIEGVVDAMCLSNELAAWAISNRIFFWNFRDDSCGEILFGGNCQKVSILIFDVTVISVETS
ncbi:hypothetical protein JAAARDRAFT_664121 [Jaapia argillacea MUCL 33604]|uniref:F-box domain-containing protein n=1 Tax=Jaapia argillacea MUCL 33604 TaxID=933084 RepID=A0A067PU08_9AGAM|nr:hypothetical protein JAAARDRAFT_664121 [Jaapia argillacea MUCL 33604]